MVYRTNGTLLLKLSFVRDRVYVTLEVGLLSFPTPLTTISLPFIDAMPQNSISLPKYDTKYLIDKKMSEIYLTLSLVIQH